MYEKCSLPINENNVDNMHLIFGTTVMTCKMDSSSRKYRARAVDSKTRRYGKELIEKGDWREKEAGCRWGPLRTKWDPILLLAEG